MRLVIGISGASGVWLGYKLLQILKSYTDIETHLVITEGAIKILHWKLRWILLRF